MEKKILAFCFDLRGYSQLLQADPDKLAKTLQFFVSFIMKRVQSLPSLEQISLQGDAVIGVCECKSKQQFNEIIACLELILQEQTQLQVQLKDAGLAPITFGLGIDWGSVIATPTCIKGPNGMLYVGRVISTAIRLSDEASRPPHQYAVAVSHAAMKQGNFRPPVASSDSGLVHYYFSKLLSTHML
ncbi:MAG: hypothetical protein ACRC6H_08690 [Culicoidibacterales bacterium]